MPELIDFIPHFDEFDELNVTEHPSVADKFIRLAIADKDNILSHQLDANLLKVLKS